jgi:Secretion system C-terminal sorting domain
MKKLILFTLFTTSFANIHAQSIAPSILNAGGGSANIAGRTFEYSIGEMAVVSTDKAGNTFLTQGLLQPIIIVAEGLSNIELGKTLFNIYPNPTSEILNIALLNNATAVNNISLFDVTGKLVAAIDNPKFTNKKYALDFSTFAFGHYILKLASLDQNFTFTINKTK